MSMNLLKLLRRRTGSAPVARERLQILLAHERGLRSQPDLLGILREEILAVVSRHVVLDPEKVIVRMDVPLRQTKTAPNIQHRQNRSPNIQHTENDLRSLW